MKNKLLILFLLVSGLAFGQSVPNTTTFTLDSVKAVIGGTSLSDIFSRAVDSDFDTTYVGAKDRLSNFRNYTIAATTTTTSGKWITAVVNGGYIYRSNDYGTNWTQVGTSQYWWGISMDTTGMYQAAVANGGYIYESNDFGVIWAQEGTSQAWSAISVSATGVYQTAVVWGGYIYTSSDYGVTWTQQGDSLDWRDVDISPTGQYQIAAVGASGVTGYVYISTDYGSTWTAETGAGLKTWGAVYVNSGGTLYYAADGNDGLLYYSVNGGTIWDAMNPLYYNYWGSIAGDSSGAHMIAGSTNGYKFYTVSGTWYQVTYNNVSGDWQLFSSSDGSYMVASNTNGYLYSSTDQGSTWWVIYSTARTWGGIATN